MSNHVCNSPKHTNGFVLLNNIPYVLAEYLDRRTFQQIDRSYIKSEVLVDNETEAMRTVFNISIDDIGHRASDGTLNVEGNNAKQRRLLSAIDNTIRQTRGELDTLRKELVLEVCYYLENIRTGQIIRSAKEKLVVNGRGYYLDTNVAHIDDNAVLVNFQDNLVSTINHFTHGLDRMILRVTEINMYYRCMRRDHSVIHQGPHGVMSRPAPDMLPTFYGAQEDNYYYYHKEMEQAHILGTPGCCGDNFGSFGHEPPGYVTNPAWDCFNRYYHFDNGGRDLILHHQEINDPRADTFLLPCGKITVNRMVTINPGQRIVFRFSIWKNDTVVVNDTTSIMRALGGRGMHDHCDYTNLPAMPELDCSRPVPPKHEIHPDYETVMRMLHDNMMIVNKQNHVINDLNNRLQYIQGLLENTHPGNCGPCCGEKTATTTADGKSYATLQETIDAIQSGEAMGPITLMEDISETVTVTGDVTIELNGHTIAAPVLENNPQFQHTIIVDGGNLVINGAGTVSNGNNQGYCVINVSSNDTWVPADQKIQSLGEGTVTLNGGTYMRTGLDDTHRGYALVNHGARFTINEGVIVDTMRDDTSLVTNGFMGDAASQPVMVINGGSFHGGRHTVNNDHGGRMIINGGTFKMGTPWIGEQQASGPKNVLRNETNSTAQIRGGEFTGNVENNNDTAKSLQISGGTFTVDVSKYVVDGMKQDRNGKIIADA